MPSWMGFIKSDLQMEIHCHIVSLQLTQQPKTNSRRSFKNQKTIRVGLWLIEAKINEIDKSMMKLESPDARDKTFLIKQSQ